MSKTVSLADAARVERYFRTLGVPHPIGATETVLEYLGVHIQEPTNPKACESYCPHLWDTAKACLCPARATPDQLGAHRRG